MTDFGHFVTYVNNVAVLLITVNGPAAADTIYITHSSSHSF